MSEVLQHRAERLKLARLLAVPVADLPALDTVPSADLAELRERVTDRLFDESARALGRVGAASRLVPAAVTATIARKAFGPLLCARAAGSIDPGKAVDVAGRLPADFLADVTVELDPRRVADIIAGVSAELVVPVATELGRREEHVTMGRFLAFVPDGPLEAAMAALGDEEMLRTAFVLEHKDRLDHAVGLLAPDRVPGILRCAHEHGLWPEALDLLGHLTDERLGPIADDLSSLGDDVVDSLLGAVAAGDLWDALLPVVVLMSPEGRLRLATVPAIHRTDVLAPVVSSAVRLGLWGDLLPLISALPDDVRALVPGLVAALDRADLEAAVRTAVRRPEQLRALRTWIDDSDGEGRDLVAAILRGATA